ncbi:MAG: AmmeMemoRadiSam system protein A [Acidobacteriota bacterium]|nr:AmmeMemoRadiSam system protein A [Acidobacteriota bacterium]
MTPDPQDTLSPRERRTLLTLARAAIADRLVRDGSLDRALVEIELTPALETPRGVFVTLREGATDKTKGQLRGCIGSMSPTEPLFRAVIRSARSSAFDDPRFDPIVAEQLPKIRLEISALTPLVSVEGPEAIVPGRDGVQLAKDDHRAVFLPQVATEQGWDTRRLLEGLALKAGLPRDGWRGARLETFRAEVFGEDA